MSMVISATSLMRQAYSGNTLFKDENYRKNRMNHEVMNADRKAMTRALDQLDSLDFDSTEEDDTKQIYNAVNAYLDVYNNAVSTALDSDSSDIQRTGKNMRLLMKDYEQELKDIGIDIKSNGTVKIDKTEMKKATTRQVSKIFGNDDYKNSMRTLMKKLRNQINREGVGVTQQTGSSKSSSAKNDTTGSGSTASTTSLTETVGRNLNLYV